MKVHARIVLAAVLAAGTVTHLEPASAHAETKCEFEAFDLCMESDLPRSWCYGVAERQCAVHSHGGGNGIDPANFRHTSESSHDPIILNEPKMKLQRN